MLDNHRSINALAETIIGLYKTELIRRRGPWKGIDDVEYGTLEWVDWFNHRRLLEPIGSVPPAEFEAAYHRERDEAPATETDRGASIAPVSRATPAVKPALRRSDGLVFGADGESRAAEAGSSPHVGSGGPLADHRGEVRHSGRNVETQATKSP